MAFRRAPWYFQDPTPNFDLRHLEHGGTTDQVLEVRKKQTGTVVIQPWEGQTYDDMISFDAFC